MGNWRVRDARKEDVDHAVGALIPIPEDEDIEAVFCQVENEHWEFKRDILLAILQ